MADITTALRVFNTDTIANVQETSSCLKPSNSWIPATRAAASSFVRSKVITKPVISVGKSLFLGKEIKSLR